MKSYPLMMAQIGINNFGNVCTYNLESSCVSTNFGNVSVFLFCCSFLIQFTFSDRFENGHSLGVSSRCQEAWNISNQIWIHVVAVVVTTIPHSYAELFSFISRKLQMVIQLQQRLTAC